jgi:hypothetical protein
METENNTVQFIKNNFPANVLTVTNQGIKEINYKQFE